MKKLLLQIIKYLLLPFGVLYGIITAIRNKMYDLGWFQSFEFSLPVICIGNITAGGTGKTPQTAYLIELLSRNYVTAVLSRGYGRYTKGFRLAHTGSTAREIGDEPFLYFSKYPQVTVAVAEERMTAIPELLQKKPDIQIILLDDAFQHRSVKAGINILITDYHHLYTKDFVLPFGMLRESRKGAKRADIIIVSKCPDNITKDEKISITNEINPLSHQQVFFTKIQYGMLYSLSDKQKEINENTYIILVTGIAYPEPLLSHLKKTFHNIHHIAYNDHHYFTYNDIDEIHAAYLHIPTENKIVVSTEKDVSRLKLFEKEILEKELPIYAQPIETVFIDEDEYKFNTHIQNYVLKHYPIIINETVEITDVL